MSISVMTPEDKGLSLYIISSLMVFSDDINYINIGHKIRNDLAHRENPHSDNSSLHTAESVYDDSNFISEVYDKYESDIVSFKEILVQ